VQVKHNDEKNVTWRDFKRYFEKKYLTKHSYDRKMKEFFELKPGSMTIDDYKRRFLELLKYLPYIKDEQVNIQRYLSGIPSFSRDKIQYDDPKIVEETIRRDKCLYDQHRHKSNFQNTWEGKKINKTKQRKKGRKLHFFRNSTQRQLAPKEPRMIESMGQRPRKQPMKCWGCNGDHMYWYFPHRAKKVRVVDNVQQDETIEDMGRNVPRIYATLDNKQNKF
jgi:hypothetical protein